MLQQIETNGKTYPVNFGIRALAATADTLGMTLETLARESLVADLPVGRLIQLVLTVTAVALTDGARKAAAPHAYTPDDVADLVDADPALLPQLVALFRASLGDGRPVFPTAAPEPAPAAAPHAEAAEAAAGTAPAATTAPAGTTKPAGKARNPAPPAARSARRAAAKTGTGR